MAQDSSVGVQMLKWAEFIDGDTLYEAFLPEADQDASGWRLIAVRRGHIIAERAVRLLYRPTFGPDLGDVQSLEAALNALIENVSSMSTPEGDGNYEAGTILISPPDPVVHSFLDELKKRFVESIAAMELPPEWVCDLLEMPVGWAAENLYPVAITKKRECRMQRVVALKTLSELHPSLGLKRTELLDSILVDDIDRLRAILQASGIRTD